MLSARSAFAGQQFTNAGGALVAMDRDGLGMASLSVRRGQRALLEQRILDNFGLKLSAGPFRHVAGDIAVLGTGPGSWLIINEGAGNGLCPTLLSAVGDSASVTDQSDACGVIRLTGPALRDTLSKLVSLDVHARIFRVGDVAATILAHMGVLMWRLEDGADGQPVFEIAVPRSYAASFRHEISCYSL